MVTTTFSEATTTRRVATLAVSLLTLVVGPASAGAAASEPAVPAPARAETRVLAIAATPTGDVDPVLRPLGDKLRRVFPGYSGFRLVSTEHLDLARGRAGQVTLPNGDVLRLTYNGTDGKLVKMLVEIPPRLRTRVRVHDGGTFFQAGMPYQGGILVLAITPTLR